LADTSGGLTGTEIGGLLQTLGIDDSSPGITKRHRLFAALGGRQRRDRCANLIVSFIQTAMEPVRFTNDPNMFEARRSGLNQVLAFSGYSLGEDGKLRHQPVARTLTEAEERAGRLQAELRRRGVHPDVLAFCRAELLDQNYFHAVLEATKSVADKIRQRTALQGDGPELVDQAFSLGKTGIPMLAFNRLQTETERSEQSGLMNVMKGMFGAFRNVTAHAPRVSWLITEQDALDLLTIASLLHRRIDAAASTEPHP
jgi:uncharacterized protein (TIGR02391 family)